MSARRLLSNRRPAETFELRHGHQRAYFTVTVGYYEDGAIGEIFISSSKIGTEVEAVARDGAVLVSLALQYGVPLGTIAGALTREGDGRPSTIVGAVIDRLVGMQKDGS